MYKRHATKVEASLFTLDQSRAPKVWDYPSLVVCHRALIGQPPEIKFTQNASAPPQFAALPRSPSPSLPTPKMIRWAIVMAECLGKLLR